MARNPENKAGQLVCQFESDQNIDDDLIHDMLKCTVKAYASLIPFLPQCMLLIFELKEMKITLKGSWRSVTKSWLLCWQRTKARHFAFKTANCKTSGG